MYRLASELPEGPAPAAGLLLYNWAVALSDCARIVRPQQPDEARELLGAAAAKYAASLEASPFSHQALNNYGLVLTDLAALRPPGERATYAAHAVAKFRRAVRLRPDFERAVYNLGTVAYAQACTAQEELLAAAECGGGGAAHVAAERAVKAAFAHAAQYIALAYALQPDKPGGPYRDSLAAVQRLLPLPHLRAGPLRCVAPETAGSPNERWTAAWFALDAGGLRAARPPVADSAAAAAASVNGSPMAAAAAAAALPAIMWQLQDITSVRTVCDPSLPAGHAFWLGLAASPAGAYLIAAEAEEAEGWVDALSLLLHLSQQQRLEGLQRALAMPLTRAAAT